MNQGIFMRGVIIDRWKEQCDGKNGRYEHVRYLVNCGGQIFRLHDYDPKEYLDVGEEIDMPVRVGSFQSQNGIVVTYTVAKDGESASRF